MAQVHVCGHRDLPRIAAYARPSHAITILHPEEPVPQIDGIEQCNRLCLTFDDVSTESQDWRSVSRADVEAALALARAWTRERPLLVHCRFGISRSMSLAYLAMCDANPGREDEVARRLRDAAPFAVLNPRIVRVGAELLGEGVYTKGLRTMGVPQGGAPGPIAVDLLLPSPIAAAPGS